MHRQSHEDRDGDCIPKQAHEGSSEKHIGNLKSHFVMIMLNYHIVTLLMLYWTHCSHFHFSYIRLWRGRILYSEHARRKLNVIYYTHRRRNEAAIIKGSTALKQNWHNWKVNDSNQYKMTPILKNEIILSGLMYHQLNENHYF